MEWEPAADVVRYQEREGAAAFVDRASAAQLVLKGKGWPGDAAPVSVCAISRGWALNFRCSVTGNYAIRRLVAWLQILCGNHHLLVFASRA